MQLSEKEYRAMNHPVRRGFQRWLEYPVFSLLGLRGQGRDILEIGCGNGYGAKLLARLKPKSYVGIDVMPEMVSLARKQSGLANAEFFVQDAADLSRFADESKDIVVIFGILHHVPAWRKVLQECQRVLRPGGQLFLEEPNRAAILLWDRFLHWGHDPEALFTWSEFDSHLINLGFHIRHCWGVYYFRSYSIKKL